MADKPKLVTGYIGEAKVQTTEENAQRLGSQFSTKAPAKKAASSSTSSK